MAIEEKEENSYISKNTSSLQKAHPFLSSYLYSTHFITSLLSFSIHFILPFSVDEMEWSSQVSSAYRVHFFLSCDKNATHTHTQPCLFCSLAPCLCCCSPFVVFLVFHGSFCWLYFYFSKKNSLAHYLYIVNSSLLSVSFSCLNSNDNNVCPLVIHINALITF